LSAAGSGDDFESLYREAFPLVVRTVYLVIFDREVAQEITHEAFLRLWQYRDRLGEHANPRAWLLKVAVNLAIDHRRSLLASFRIRLVPPASEDPADAALAHLDRVRMRRALLRMQARDRALLVLRFYQGLSFPEISRIVGHPEPTVRTWLHRALNRLQTQLDDGQPGWIMDKA
jgi:RNA polymerase sigma factor (sigma-70 family)